MTMKRNREDREVEALAMANCLMLLSRVGETASSSGRVFECKTCNRQFSSFQALGGHRASHKRPKVMAGELVIDQPAGSPPKPKTHECTICGLEFPIGQALGGHMRRHRPVNVNNHSTEAAAAAVVDIMKSSSKRVFSLDLNLTPYENHLKSKFGKMLTV